MFTGLIEGLGRVEGLSRRGPDAVIRVAAGFDLGGTLLGDSIAVSGPCLSVTSLSGNTFSADVSAETLSKTNLTSLRPGATVNLERALRLGDRLGGHLVSGHIDGQARLLSKENLGASIRLRYQVGSDLIRYIIPKGSVALDGVSLTVNEVGRDFFEVNIIPQTAEKTTLGLNKPGEMINIETDLIGKYVEKLLGPHNPHKNDITREYLAEHGFLD
jgi:riboflavin synthase